VAKRIELEVNDRKYPIHFDADTPLLFISTEEIGLTGAKYGVERNSVERAPY
jgi:hypothetical protein